MTRRLIWRVLLASAFTLVAAVIVLAVHYRRQARIALERLNIQLDGDLTIAEDPEIGFVPAKNGVTFRREPNTGLAFHLYTDDRRGRVDRPGGSAPTRVDVVAVGCSFTWGHGVENEDTYLKRLAESLHLTAENLALGSYGTVQSLLMLQRNLDLRPSVVIYGFMADHFRRNLTPCAPNYGPLCLPCPYVAFDQSGNPSIRPPSRGFEENRSFYEQFLFDRSLTAGKAWILARADLKRIVSRPQPPASSAELAGPALAFLLRQMRAATRSIDARLIIVAIPDLSVAAPTTAMTELETAVREIAGDDVLYLDLTPAVVDYNAAGSRPSLTFARDKHPSVAGHAFIARELGALFVKRQLLSQSPQSPRR